MTLAIKRSPRGAQSRRRVSACGAGDQQTNHTKRRGVLRARIYPLGPLRRPQASSNTYPNGLTPRQQTAALQRLCTTFDERKSSMRRKRITRHHGKPVKDVAPVLAPTLENLAAVLEQIAVMDALPPASAPPPRRERRRCAS